ncbi:MAG: type II CAAX prenyl endopeptidase Rce1 family protein [Rubricoccaceae bacterium]
MTDPRDTPPPPDDGAPRPPTAPVDPGLLLRPPPALADAWPGTRPFRLTGWLERSGFTPGWTALLVFVLTFFVFQVVGGIAVAVVAAVEIARTGGDAPPDPAAILASITDRPYLLLSSNAAGQWVGFALVSILVARLHSPDWAGFLRLRRPPDWSGLALAGLGWLAIAPLVQWLGRLNEALPLPPRLQEFETMQLEMLEQLLLGANLNPWFLLLAVAVTPAVCEELLFRGYLQRQTERVGGTLVSIVLVGVVFGLYHLRFSQALPLATLGVYLGFVVWATGSLWAGVLVHLLNNGAAVLATSYVAARPDLDPAMIEDLPVPWYLGLLSLGVTLALCARLAARRRAACGDRPDAAPLADPAPPLSALSS